ncbi:hypothetical protein KCU93_g10300, partial [Aureobasidium melanogenum]
MAFSFARAPFVCSSEPISVDGQPWPELSSNTEPVDVDVPGLEAWNANFYSQTEETAESPDLTPEDSLEPMPAWLVAAWPQATSRESVMKGKDTAADKARKRGAKRPRESSDGEGSVQDQGKSKVDVETDGPVSKTAAAPKKTAAAPKKTAAPKPAPKKQKLLGSDDPKQMKMTSFFNTTQAQDHISWPRASDSKTAMAAPVRMDQPQTWPPNRKYEHWHNMPCKALDDYDGSLENTIKVKKGARGYVSRVAKDRNTGVVWFRVLPCDAIKGHEQGLVPSPVVELGTERKYKDTVLTLEGQNFEEMVPEISLSRLDLTDDDAPFIKNSAAFLKAILDGRNDLRFVPEPAFAYINKTTPLVLAKTIRGIIQRTNPNLMNLLDSGKPFTVQDLRLACPVLNDIHTLGGIYLRYYATNKGDKAIYIGQSVNMRRRQGDHELNIKNPNKKAYHYRLARGATTREARMMCRTDDRILLDIIEQLMISLLESYAPFVKNKSRDSVEFKLETDIIANDPTQGPFQIQKTEEFAEKDFTLQSRMLFEVFNRVKHRTKWPGCCDSKDFGARGLNHQSPLVTFARAEQMFWTKMVLPEAGLTQYRRPPIKVAAHNNAAGQPQHDVPVVNNASTHRIIVSGLSDEEIFAKASELSLQWGADEVGPPVGVDATVCVEIMHNGAYHPNNWAGLPTVGPWKNWNRANSLAIRLEWAVGGQHYVCYFRSFIQHDIIQDRNKRNTVGAFRPYAVAEGLRRYLEQETVTNPEDWYTYYGRSRVKEVDFEWLRQAWTFTDLTPPPPVARESLKTGQEIYTELRRAGFPDSDIGGERGKIVQRPVVAKNRPGRIFWTRTTCDRCYIANIDTDDLGYLPAGTPSRRQKVSRVHDNCAPWPPEDKDSRYCQHCFDFGMVCTWSPSYELWETPAKLDAISFQPRTNKSRKILKTPDPRSVHQTNQKPMLPD